MKIGIVGDLHLKENLGYADYIEDRRWQERQEVLTAIVNNLKDCDKIVLMGDSLNGRNNPSQIIKELVAFLKRFGKKDVYILAGNHEKLADGRSAIDFLRELKIPNWHVVTNEVTIIEDMVFCPYFSRQEFGAKTNDEATEKLMKMLTGRGKKMLFIHHSISDTKVTKNVTTDFFNEIVLPRKELEKEYDFICAGHIHQHSQDGKVLVTGSIFNNEVGEHQKYIWKYEENGTEKHWEKIALPGRGIYQIKDDAEAINDVPPDNIIKFILTEKRSDEEIVEIKKRLKIVADAYLLLERYPAKRGKVDMEGMTLDFAPEAMLEMYAKERKVDLTKLKKAYNIIK